MNAREHMIWLDADKPVSEPVRDHYTPTGAVPFSAAQEPAQAPRRRRNQYTPVLERPAIWWTLVIAVGAVVTMSVAGWLP